MILKITVIAVAIGCAPMMRPEADADAKRAVLAQVIEGVLLPTLGSFVSEAEALETAAIAWREARRSGPASVERDAAKAAFKAAFVRWQRAELLAFGPAGKAPGFTLGQGLRDTVYSWPIINPCRVDTVLTDRLYAEPGFFDTALVTTTGLDAIEAVLFSEASANTCPASATINTAGTWAALSPDELAVRRAEYASLAAGALVRNARLLRTAWLADAAKFTTAGLAGSPFPTAQAGLNELFSAMFQADLALKNARIGVPSGLATTGCPMTACPELAEALPSGLSREAIVGNLDGLRALLRGSFEASGTGFDALLEARGAGSLAADMDAALLVARARAEALPAPIDQAVLTHLADVRQLHADVKVFTDLLKSPFVTVLSLQVPAEGAGDAD